MNGGFSRSKGKSNVSGNEGKPATQMDENP
jgi:hypothetical protein